MAQWAAIPGGSGLYGGFANHTTEGAQHAMAKVEHTADACVLVGIDVSKHRHEVLISVPGKTRWRRLTITNTLEDFQRLIALLSDYHLPVQIGFEGQGIALTATTIAP